MPMTVEDYFEIQRLVHTYPYLLDRGDLEGMGRLFADAVVYSGGALMADRSAEAMTAAFRDWLVLYPDGTPRTRHCLSNVIIEPAGEGRAIVRSYVIVFQQADQRPLQAVIGGDYLDTVEKSGGAWRFVERRMGNDLIGDLTAHGRDFGVIRPTRAN